MNCGTKKDYFEMNGVEVLPIWKTTPKLYGMYHVGRNWKRNTQKNKTNDRRR